MNERTENSAQNADPPSPPPVASRQQFLSVAPLYDALMTDVPYNGWVGYLRRLLELRKARPRNVLDLACGTGNVAELLCSEGYDVTGVDIADAMIAEARRKATSAGLPIAYFVQDAAELDLPGRRFALCVSLFDSLNYVLEPDRAARRTSDAQRALHLRS